MAEQQAEQQPQQEQQIPEQEYGLTLNRWHKVVERINTRLNEISSETVVAASPVNMYLVKGSSLKNLDPARAKLNGLIEEYNLLVSTVYVIKSAIGTKNAELGVTDKLGLQAALRSQVNYLKRLASYAKQDALTEDDAKARLEAINAADDRTSIDNYVTVTPFGSNDADQIEGRTKGIERNIHRLADEISDANKERVSLSIPVYAAAVAGLEVNVNENGANANGSDGSSTAGSAK